jgi:ferredoxin
MPGLTIDNRYIEVPPGATILDAARKLKIDVPSLCFLEGHPPATSCMVCLVKIKGQDRFVPSCATPAEEGMQVESESNEVRRLRRTGLELLLSDHTGDCAAPCENTCPARMDIPLMLREVQSGDMRAAIATIKKEIALPAILGRVCPEICEKGCRLAEEGSPAAICQIKRAIADADLASGSPYLPPCEADTDRSVAIIGAGPAGLSAAFHLRQYGHQCTLFDRQAKPGGTLRHDPAALGVEGLLPEYILDGEIDVIARLGAVFRMNVEVGRDVSLDQLRGTFDAVLVATGPLPGSKTEFLGLPVIRRRIQADRRTHRTEHEDVFAAGDAVRPGNLVVRAVADGKAAARCIHQFLSGQEVVGEPQAYTFRSGLTGYVDEESGSGEVIAIRRPRVPTPSDPSVSLALEQCRSEASRCLQCDCSARSMCKLRYYSEQYRAVAHRFRGERHQLQRRVHGKHVIFEPGKCILCGLCIRVAEEAREPLGLTFIGRGFDVLVGVPLDGSLNEALKRSARECAEACPTGALTYQPKEMGVKRPGGWM